MADIRIRQLPDGSGPLASDYIPLDNGTTRRATVQQVVEIGRPTASQAEAEAGVESSKVMTPLTTQQAVTFYGLTKDGNLAGLTNTTTARVNLGLGSSAVEDASAFQPSNSNLTTLAGVTPGSAGLAILADDLQADVRDYLDTPPYVANRTALKALDTTKDTVAFLSETGREGVFKWTAGDYSTQIAADTQEGVYVKADAIASTAGAWVRVGWEHGLVLTWFGAQRGYANDSRSAILAAISFSQTFEVAIRDKGVYGVVGNIEITGSPVTIDGLVGAPHIWFATSDDGDNLRPGFKDDIPGLVFIFKNGGTPTSFSLTNRTDDYATVTPCLAVSSVQNTIRRLAIVQDMNVFDASGNYNDIAEVAASLADDFDVGVLVNDTRQNLFDDVTVFGYFSKAGYVVHSKSGDDDPDYNQWIGGSAYGRHGVALLGANDAPASYGLSGSQFYGVRIGAKDSKGRVATDTATDHYASADDWRCVYIDGDTDGSTAEINGHYFTSCVLRTASDHALELDHASNAVFSGCIFEHNFYSVPNSTSTPTFIASTNTKKGTQFLGCRINYLTMIFHADFVGALAAGIGVFVQGDPIQSRAGWVYSDPNVVGGYAATIVGGDGNVGDPSVQFTKDANNQSAGWKILMDVSAGDPIQFRYAGSSVFDINTTGVRVPAAGERRLIHEVPGALTISGGVITATRSYHLIATEGGAASDDLDTINGGVAGMRLLLRCSTASQTITITRTGNIRLDGSTNKVIATTGSYIELFYDGSFWRQISPVMVTG